MTSITWHAAPASVEQNGDFVDSLYEFFVPLEAATQSERLNPSLVGGAHNVTIGVGFDLNKGGDTVVNAVLVGLGFDSNVVKLLASYVAGSGADIEYQYIERIRTAITSRDITKLNSIMAERAANADSQYLQFIQSEGLIVRKTSFSFSSDNEVRSVFRSLWDAQYRKSVTALIPELSAAPANTSREMMVLASLNWHGMIGSKVAQAISSGNRAEAWFQIRYGWAIPSQDVPGTAKRQYLEATVFGLYGNGASAANVDEAASVYQMFTEHRDRIIDYEITRNFQTTAVSSANSTLNSTAFANLTVNTLSIELQSAANFLINQYASGKAFNSLNIQVAKETAFINGNLFVGGGTLYGENSALPTGNDDLLVGSNLDTDFLYGQAGNDVLVGRGGNDYLEGGAGSDTLEGPWLGSGLESCIARSRFKT